MIEETTLQQIEARCDAPQVQWKEIHDDVRLLLAEVRRVYAWAAEMQEMAEKAKPAFAEITEAYTKLDRRVTELKSQLSNEEDEHSKDRKSMLSFQSKLIESDEENVSLRNQVAQLEAEITQSRLNLRKWEMQFEEMEKALDRGLALADAQGIKLARIENWCKLQPPADAETVAAEAVRKVLGEIQKVINEGSGS
jgi:chromosome segregation ATPase